MQSCFKRAAAKRFPEEALARAFSFRICRASYLLLAENGRVAERLNAAVSKTVLPITWVTRVQIPPLPPEESKAPTRELFSFPNTSGTDWGRSPFCLLAHQGLRHRLWHYRVPDKIVPDTFLSGLVLCLAPKCPGRIDVRAEWGRMNFRLKE